MAVIEKDIVEEPTRGSGLERLVAIATKGQPTRRSYHRTYVDWATKLGRQEEEGLEVGNQKFQLLERATGSPQMPYQIW